MMGAPTPPKAHRRPGAAAIPDATASHPATEATGLTAAEAAQRLHSDGPNALGTEGRRSLLRVLINQFASPLVLILIAASLVSMVVGDQVEAGIILAIVGMSAALGFVQEARSEAAVAALQARLALQATVVRDGREQDVPISGVVRGDLVVLGAGDIVPADVRLVETNHLFIDESSLTGESAAALKQARPADATVSPTKDADRDAFAFFGTSVVSGSGKALVTATGARTSYGAIAKRLAERAPETDFQHGVRLFGILVAKVTLTLVVGVFAINVALGRGLYEALLFSIALAVGLTPEMLPAIVTLNLTRGARALAAHGVLVKRLPAIQNLGSMTVLCTDKTGTLTEGKLELVRAVGIDQDDASAASAPKSSADAASAAEASHTLELAYFNSHFQASFVNPLDTAILAATKAPDDLSSYKKLAEVPYDFNRRCLSVVVQRGDEPPMLITKGAPEQIVSLSKTVREDGSARPILKAEHDRLSKLVDGASADGFRLVAVGSRVLAPAELADKGAADLAGLERDLTFEGVLLFSDPPKKGVAGVIRRLAAQKVSLKVITGDNDLVARHVAAQVGLQVDEVLTGDQMRKLTHPALVARAPRTTIFARVDPDQKLQVIRALRESGAVVGYMGDGINDAPALHVADVGISVSNATDVARSAADIILLEPSLAAISQGVTEGRRTFANTLKYIRMGTSSNFGNMLSMAGAALLLRAFLPMTPGQILLNNLIYDASQIAIPTDTVDPEVEAEPARWDVHSIERFMLLFGPISSIFDYVTFGLLLWLVGSSEASGPAFHSGWFVESLFTQILVVLVIRTRRSPFWRSRPSPQLAAAIAAALLVAVVIPISPLGLFLGFDPLPLAFWPLLIVVTAAYLVLVETAKYFFNRRFGASAPNGAAAGK